MLTAKGEVKFLPWGKVGSLQWDVMEFAEMMDSNGL